MKLRQAKKIHKKFLQVNYRKGTLYAANKRTYGTLSLLPRIRNKTLHIKQFEPIEQDPLFQTLRDCYDRAEATRRYTLQTKMALKNLAFQIMYQGNLNETKTSQEN